MQKIIPNFWFDSQSEKAAQLYTSIFKNSKMGTVTHYDAKSSKVANKPAGSVLTVDFELEGYKFVALNGGPQFKLNPSISMIANFDPSRETNAREYLDTVWAKLAEGGIIRMPLQKYPFSEWYGWIEDTFGVSWQLMLTDPKGEPRPFFIPSMLFTQKVDGRAEEALNFYTSFFKNSKLGNIVRYPAGMETNKEGNVMFGECMLEGQWFAAMDGGQVHDFAFNEAFSFVINCVDQAEVDYYWSALTEGGGSESVCGWLKDKFGVSWQVVPVGFYKLMKGEPEKVERAMAAMLQMKKLDIATLEKAYAGA
ncbi:MAG TPA: VOC family protein [Candidatus Paceibacterota bacterium]|nr:VOC family protein [Candidatus Paceibacterota bacterium]